MIAFKNNNFVSVQLFRDTIFRNIYKLWGTKNKGQLENIDHPRTSGQPVYL